MVKIATKTGDKGISGLLSGERLSKSESVFDALGDLDELSVFIGSAKLANIQEGVSRISELSTIQLDLINLMGELAYTKYDYTQKYNHIDELALKRLDDVVNELQEDPRLQQTTWVIYGKTSLGNKYDIVSKICRRAERRIVALQPREEILKYVNRLSDYFYLIAREADLCQS